MKIKIYNMVSDTDHGTQTSSWPTLAEAEADFVATINGYIEHENQYADPQLVPATTYDEACHLYQELIDNFACIDSFGVHEEEIELGPKPPAEGLQRFYVTMTWDNFPEGGTYGNIVWAKDYDEAEALIIEEMLDHRQEDWIDGDEDDSDEAREAFRAGFAQEWHVVDCFPLNDFIERHIAS